MATNYRSSLVEFALSQVGVTAPTGDDKYIKYYNSITGSGFSVNGTPWCAIFVTYCARNVGIPTTIIPNFASCTTSRDSFWKPNNRWKSPSNYTPMAGDIIYFDWDDTGDCDHVGIVVDVKDGYVYTVEGNTKGSYKTYGVRYKSYGLKSSLIAGYADPDYEKLGDEVIETPTTGDSAITTGIKAFQRWINNYINAGLIIDGSCGPLTKTAAIKCIQTIMNKEYGKSLAVDGSYGPATKAAVQYIQYGYKGNLAYVAQGLLYGHKIDPDGFDGSFGPGMLTAIKQFQSWAGITVDGSCGPDTWYNLNKKW